MIVEFQVRNFNTENNFTFQFHVNNEEKLIKIFDDIIEMNNDELYAITHVNLKNRIITLLIRISVERLSIIRDKIKYNVGKYYSVI